MERDKQILCPHQIECSSFFVYAKSMSEELCLTFKKMYCQDDYKKCARCMVIDQGRGELLSSDILPNQEMRARSLVQEDQKLYS